MVVNSYVSNQVIKEKLFLVVKKDADQRSIVLLICQTDIYSIGSFRLL